MYCGSDVIEYLFSTTGGGAQDQEHRVLRQSLFHGYREVVTARDWRWYHTVEEINVAPFLTTHTLPWGVSSVDSVQTTEQVLLATYVEPMEFERLLRNEYRDLVRLVWTITPSQFSPDRFDLKIINGDRSTRTATLTYRRRPRDLRCTGWEPTSRVGTVDWNGSEASGTGTEFSNQMMGAVIRVSGDAKKHPESLAGMTPYKDEGLIYQIANSAKLYAWSPAGGMSYSGTKYVITDYLDISPGMYSALLSACEMWLSRLSGKNLEGAMGVYGRDLRLAFEQDAMAPLSGRRDSGLHYWDWWYLRPGTDQGTGGGGTGGPDADGTCPNKGPLHGGDSDGPWDGNYDGGRADTVFGKCG